MSRPKLGQHFLKDPNMVRKIVRLASLEPRKKVMMDGNEFLILLSCHFPGKHVDLSLVHT